MIDTYLFHCPSTLNDYPFLSIGREKNYFNEEARLTKFKQHYKDSKAVLEATLKTAQESKHQCALVFSGYYLRQLQSIDLKMIDAIKKSLHKQEIILLGATYDFSLASLFSPELFISQIKLHQHLLKNVFDYEASIFYNTGSIYSDGLSTIYHDLGFTSAIVPNSPWHLNERDAKVAYYSKSKNIKLLLQGNNGSINLIDYPISHARDLAIIEKENSSSLDRILVEENNELYLVPQPIYDKNQIINNTLDNPLQNGVLRKIKSLRAKIKDTGNDDSKINLLSALTSLDYFEKLSNSGADNSMRPYDNYISFMNILSDFEITNNL